MKESDDEPKSKTQQKREMQSLKHLGERLLDLPEEQLQSIGDPGLLEAVTECKRITKGNARKRQIQYIGKLMRSADVDRVQQLIDRYDSSTKTHTIQFHKLERWRQELIDEDMQVIDEIIRECPNVDRQHLKQLTRNAINERERQESQPVHFRKLFQYLKFVLDSSANYDQDL
ncbi:MAG: ribosome biogenesis factor YjgA [Pseudomonadales bacterium]